MISNMEAYNINNEYELLEAIRHFDSDYIFSVINDKINNINYLGVLEDPNMVDAIERNFKIMQDTYTGDTQNIKIIREQLYLQIIDLLCSRFNLQYNTVDPNIDLYTAAKYLYEFLVCNRSTMIIQFFTTAIINYKEFIYNSINSSISRRDKNASTSYAKTVYDDEKYILIASNVSMATNYIYSMDIKLSDIFATVYKDPNVVQFLDNAFADRGSFFRDVYWHDITNPESGPMLISNIKMALHSMVNSNNTTIEDYINK